MSISNLFAASLSQPGNPEQGYIDVIFDKLAEEDMPKNDVHASAHAALVRLFYCAGIVPLNDHQGLALALVQEGISDGMVLRMVLDADTALLSRIGMKTGQQSCLLRYLNRTSSACDMSSASHDDPETAAVTNLKSFFAAAGVVPIAHYEQIAQRLIDQGVADEVSMRDSIRSSTLDLKDVVVKVGQAYTILRALESETWATSQLQYRSGNLREEFAPTVHLEATTSTEKSAASEYAQCDDDTLRMQVVSPRNSDVPMSDQNQSSREAEAGCVSEFAQMLSRDLDLVSENFQLAQFDPEINPEIPRQMNLNSGSTSPELSSLLPSRTDTTSPFRD